MVDLNEYIEDIFPDLNGGSLPNYAQEEVELFRNRRDTNGDGQLDLQEVRIYLHFNCVLEFFTKINKHIPSYIVVDNVNNGPQLETACYTNNWF